MNEANHANDHQTTRARETIAHKQNPNNMKKKEKKRDQGKVPDGQKPINERERVGQLSQ